MSGDYENTFPPELWVCTFRFLPLKDLLHCSLVSREWHELSQEESLWRGLSVNRFGHLLNRSHFLKLCSLQHTKCDRAIKLKVISCDGGEYSSSYSVQNLLERNAVYCSKKANNVNIVLAANVESIGMMISSLVLETPMGGFTAPVADTLVFFSDELPPAEKSTCYDDFTKQNWEELQEYRKGGNVPEESKAWMAELAEYPIVPVAFMETHLQGSTWASKGQPTAQWNFSPGVLTKYIHLKLLRENYTGGNIDIKYFGAMGTNVTQGVLDGTQREEPEELQANACTSPRYRRTVRVDDEDSSYLSEEDRDDFIMDDEYDDDFGDDDDAVDH